MIALWCMTAFAAAPLNNRAGTPFTYGGDGGKVAFGVFQPVVVGLTDTVDLSTSGLATLVAPRVELKWAVASGGDDRLEDGLAVVGGLGVPTGGLLLLRGLVFNEEAAIPGAVVIRAGAVMGLRSGSVTGALGAEVRGAIEGGEDSLRPTGLWFLDPMLAPVTEGPVAAIRGVFDVGWADDKFDLTVDAHVQVGGQGTDGVARILVAVRPASAFAIAAGAAGTVESGDDGVDAWGAPIGDLLFRF